MGFHDIIRHEKVARFVGYGKISNNLIRDNIDVPNSNLGSSSKNPPESIDSGGFFLAFTTFLVNLFLRFFVDPHRDPHAEMFGEGQRAPDRKFRLPAWLFCDLADVHVYFELLRLEWKLRLDRAWYMGYEFPQNFLQVEYLDEMPDRLLTLHQQALDLLTQIWITDTSERSVDEKMTACYLEAEQAGKEEFYTWSEKGKEKKAECEKGKITVEEFS